MAFRSKGYETFEAVRTSLGSRFGRESGNGGLTLNLNNLVERDDYLPFQVVPSSLGIGPMFASHCCLFFIIE